MSTKHDIKDLLKAHGFEFSKVGSKGHQVWEKEGKTITVPTTPSDFRTLKNIRATIRRLG